MNTEQRAKEDLSQLEVRNDLSINLTGLKARLDDLLMSGNVDEAKKMFASHAEEADAALKEYDVKKHKVFDREDKKREGKPDYEVVKVPRALQRVINEDNCYMMFNNPLKFSLQNKKKEDRERLEPALEAFTDFLEEVYFNERMSEAKRIAGSETESAKLYRLYTNEDGKSKVVCQVLANSKKQRLYPMFNQYDEMVAFGVGYFMQSPDMSGIDEFFDVYTSKIIYKCSRKRNGGTVWHVETSENEYGKIPVIYYNQEKEWEGAQDRIERLEMVDSVRGDNANYFGSPYMKISRDVLDDRLAGPEDQGKVIALDGKDSIFEFVAPPECSEIVDADKSDMQMSIFTDTFTTDRSFSAIKGMGTLSDKAMRRGNQPAYMKMGIRAITYNPLIKREISLIKTILIRYKYLDDVKMAKMLNEAKIGFSYRDPFVGGIDDNSDEISKLRAADAISIETAVEMNRFVTDKEAEVERIWKNIERKAMIEAKAAKSASESGNSGNNGEGDGKVEPE